MNDSDKHAKYERVRASLVAKLRTNAEDQKLLTEAEWQQFDEADAWLRGWDAREKAKVLK